MEFLNKVFEQRDKPISDSSKKLCTRNLMKLKNDMPITNLNFLKEPKQILHMIKDYKPTTQRSYIIAVCTVLKNSKHQNLYDMYACIWKCTPPRDSRQGRVPPSTHTPPYTQLPR